MSSEAFPRLVMSLVISLVVRSVHADCIAAFDGSSCNSKAEMVNLGFGSYFDQGDDSPCFTHEGKTQCFFTYQGAKNYITDCTCSGSSSGSSEPQSIAVAAGTSTGSAIGSATASCKAVSQWGMSSCPLKSDYCDISAEHSGCKYCGLSSSNCGSEVCFRGLTEADRLAILNKHNELRSRVAKGQESLGIGGKQPSATNMIQLEYSVELEYVAQAWTDQCTFGHDKTPRNALLYDGWTGQNAYTSSTTSGFVKNLADGVQKWYDEVKDMPATGIASGYFSALTGHYSQVVAARTQKVGCGFVLYKKNGWNKQILTCNYYPGGNFNSLAHYESGATASNCPPGFSKNDTNGLCKKD